VVCLLVAGRVPAFRMLIAALWSAFIADPQASHSYTAWLLRCFFSLTPQQEQVVLVDLLQSAGAFKGKPLKAEEEFDLRFADLNAASPTAQEVGN
jgi:hypothetical protein